MVKIAHLADTHLGFRLREGLINRWKIKNKITWYESKVYQAWNLIIDEILKNKNGLDLVIHAGDIYHTPYKGYPYPPIENARSVLMRSLKYFFKETQEKIPFILIDGNHGIYPEYEYSPIDPIKEVFPNFHYFSKNNLRYAIREKKQLSFKLEDKKINVNMFPYFDFSFMKEYETAYSKWITSVQVPIAGYTNIAVAHGMISDKTLHPKLLEQNYDYVALGHYHNRKSLNEKTHNSGSIYPFLFGEKGPEWGMYFVDIKSDQNPKITPFNVPVKNKLIEIEIETLPKFATSDLLAKIENDLNRFKSKWDGDTASRLKVKFVGSLKLENYWQIREELEILRRQIDNTLSHNILQLIWSWEEAKTELGEDIKPGTIIEYILEDPKLEFKSFIKEKVDPEKVNLELLSELAIDSIEHALKELK
ncbi:MAG: metallophosphoesterase family protein [Candidatus Helarchaeota archaeon]